MADYVVQTTVRLDDQVSAGARTAADALNKLGDAADKAAKSSDEVIKTTSRAGPSFDTVNRKIDENAKLTVRLDGINRAYTQGLAAVRAEADAGGLSTDALAAKEARLATLRDQQTAAARRQAAAMAESFGAQAGAADKVTTASGNAAFAQRQFGVQSIQLISSIASGQPVITSFVQQGHQMVDVALSTGTGFGVMGGAIKSALGAVLSPIGLTITASLALAAAVYEVTSRSNELDSEARTLQTAISGVGRSAAVSASQLADYATKLAHTSELSKGDATAAVAQIIRTPGLTAANAQSITSLAPNVGAALGTTTQDAVKQLTEAYTGNYAAIQKLMAASNDFSLAQVTQVRNFLEQGDKASALKVVMGQLSASMDNARSNTLTPMQQAFQELGNGWNDFADRVARSAPVVAIMEKFRQATLGWAELLKNDSADVSRQIVDLNAQALRLQDTLKVQTDHGINDPETANKLAGITKQIDDLIEKGRQSVLKMDTAQPVTGVPKELQGPVNPNDRTTAQAQAVDRLTKAYADQNAVLSASLPTRAAVAAGQQAEATALAAGLNAADAAVIKQQAIATAMRQAGDAAVQEAAAQDRATGYALKMTDAIHQSSVAALQAAAAEEAHEKAVTQAGVSEAAYTKIILNRNAAQAVQAGAQQTSDLKFQLEMSDNVANAVGEQARHEVELRNAVLATTKAMVDKAAASQNPGMIKAAQDEVNAQIALGKQIDANKAKIAGNTAIDQARDEADQQERIAKAYDGSTLSITRATDAERARATLLANQLRPGMDGYAEAQSRLTAQLDRSAKASADFQQAQQSVAALANVASTAMDQLGQGIVDAFTSGSGSAVNFGNIMKSVITSVLSQLAKLAVINPIINSVLGTSLPTLGSAVNALGNNSGGGGGGGNGAGSASSGNIGSYASTGMSAYNTYSSLSNAGSGGGLFSGMGNLFSSSAMLGSTTSGTGAFASLMNYQLVGQGFIGPTLSSSAASSMGLSADAAAMAAPQTAGVTVGGALSSVGTVLAAYEVGSTIGGYLAGDSPQRQTTSKIGSGIGAVAGFAIGGPGGAFIGATVLGALGGLIGPGKKNMYSSQGISVNDKGQFEIGRMLSQVDPNAPAEEAAALSDTATINKYMAANNLRATSTGQIWQLGDNTPGGWADPSKAANFAAGFSNYRFAAANDNANPEINTALSKVLDGTSFATPADLEKAVTGVQDFLNKTVPALLLVGKTSGSLNDNIKTINTTFADAITQAHTLGVEEANLTKTRDDAIQALKDEAAKNLAVTNSQLDMQYNTALASYTGDTHLAQKNALKNFDDNAQVQRDGLMNNLVKTYGDVYKTTSEYADLMAKLEKALGEQRLDLIKSFDREAIASVTGTITNLATYASSLKGSTASPLSTSDQYYSAVDKFNAVSGAAKAGDYNSIANLPGYANALLGLSRDMYGSGTGYVADFNKVIDVLDSLSTLTADTLTASFYASQTAAQTDTIVKALNLLKTEVTGVKLAITQTTSAPSRVAQNG